MAVLKYKNGSEYKTLTSYNIAKYDVATEEANGLMSSEDKVKLDSVTWATIE